MLARATRQAGGLTDFGSCAFREPMDLLLRSLREEAQLTPQGALMMERTVLRLLCNRLKVQRDWTAHPEIQRVDIPRPLFILGLPRTGTTLLHGLLACDPSARYLHFWEGLYPSPAPVDFEHDPRIRAVEDWARGFHRLAPRLAAVHHLDPRGPEECLWLMEHTFIDLIFELRAHVPSYSAWLAQRESDTASYQYFRRMVQLLGWKRNGCHWVFKAPRHLFGLAGLLAIFPEARIVQTHRDPVEVLPSLCSLCEVLRGAASERVDKTALGAHWRDRLMRVLKNARRVRESAPPGQFLDIHYRDLLRDPIGAVARIYAHHGYEFTQKFQQRMEAWRKSNRQHRHGPHDYSPEEFGLNARSLREDFADDASFHGAAGMD